MYTIIVATVFKIENAELMSYLFCSLYSNHNVLRLHNLIFAMKKGVVLGLLIFAIAVMLFYFIGATSFAGQTPANGTYQLNGSSVFINLSTSSVVGDHYSFLDFNRSLVLWMRFDDINSTNSPYDNSTYGNNGTLLGNTIINTTGYFGNASQFNASDADRIQINSIKFPESNLSTFSFWIYPYSAGPSNQGTVFSFGSSRTIMRFNTANRLYYSRGYTTTDQVSTGAGFTISLNAWTHIVIVHNTTELSPKIYINGVENLIQNVNPVGSALSLDGNALWIGNNATSADREFNGSIDDILMFNRLLNETEAYALYNASANKYYYNFTNLQIGNYTYAGYSVNRSASTNKTELREIYIVDSIPDSTPPEVTINVPANTTYTSLPLTFNVSLNENGSVSFSLDSGINNVSMTGDQGKFGTVFTYTNASMANGGYTFRVYANNTNAKNNFTANVIFSLAVSASSSSSSSSGEEGGGNSGSGLSLSPPSCSNEWVCSNWSVCNENLTKYRVCSFNESIACSPSGDKPEEAVECSNSSLNIKKSMHHHTLKGAV